MPVNSQKLKGQKLKGVALKEVELKGMELKAEYFGHYHRVYDDDWRQEHLRQVEITEAVKVGGGVEELEGY